MSRDRDDLDRERCSRADAVLALYLDGNVDDGRGDGRDDASVPSRESGPADVATAGYAFVSEQSLADHLRDCPRCQRALRRSRRLDAALAASSGRGLGDHAMSGGTPLAELETRWFAAVSAIAATADCRDTTGDACTDGPAAAVDHAIGAAPESHALVVGRRRIATMPAVLGVSALLLIAFEVAARAADGAGPATAPAQHDWVRGDASDRDRRDLRQGDEPTAAEGDRIDGSDAATTLVERLHAARRARAASGRLEPADELPLAEVVRRFGDASRPAAERRAAGLSLLAATQPAAPAEDRAFDALIRVLAAGGDRTPTAAWLDDEMLASVRDNAAVTSALERRLAALAAPNSETPTPSGSAAAAAAPNPPPTAAGPALVATTVGADDSLAALVVASRAGAPSLDAGVRRVLRRHPELTEAVAAACRGRSRAGTALLLLDSWGDQVALGLQADDEPGAWRWFGGQSRATFRELAAALDRSGSSPQRVRCLLALGCDGDGSGIVPLVAHLKAPQRCEAVAAAAALARLPHRMLRPLLPAARAQDDGLLRAALVRAGVPATDAWLQRFDVSAAERDALRAGSLARFGQAANAFRNLGVITD